MASRGRRREGSGQHVAKPQKRDEFLRYVRFVARHAWSVLFVSVAATALLASGSSRLAVVLDPDQALPADNPYIVIDRKIRKEFGGRNFVAIAVVPESGSVWQRHVLQVVHSLTWDLLNAHGIIRQNVLSLSSPYVRIPQEHDGVLTTDYLMKDVPPDEAGIRNLRLVYEDEPLFKGTLVSEDGSAALILADFYDDVNAKQIATTIERLTAKYRSAALRIAATGNPILQHAQSTIVQLQGYYFLGTIAAIVFVLYLAFGQLQGVVLPCGTALLSTLCAMGFMGFVGIALNPWTTAAPVVILTVAAGHSAQMLKRYYEELRRLGDQLSAAIQSAHNIGFVMIAAGLTAACGFLALPILRIPQLTSFGLSVASGILAAVALEMTFMLSLRILWPSSGVHAEGVLSAPLETVLDGFARIVLRQPLRVCVGFVGVVLLAAGGYPRLTTDVNTRMYWSNASAFGRDLRVFDKHFPSTTTLNVLLEGKPGSMRTPQALQLMRGLQETMARDPDVGRTSSLADLLERTYQAFAPDEVGNRLPTDPKLVAQLLFLGESPAFRRYIDVASQRAVVRGFLNREDSGVARRVIGRLKEYLLTHPPQDIHVLVAGGVGPALVAVNQHTVTGKTLNIVILLASMVAIASILLRSALGGGYVLVPVLTSLLVIVGVFSWAGIPFDLAGASITAIGVGIGADYAIYVTFRIREELGRGTPLTAAVHTTILTSGAAVFFVALSMSAGFSVYLFATYYPLRICGLFIPLSMLGNCVAAVVFLPALVVWTRPGFIFAKRGLQTPNLSRPVEDNSS